MKLFITGAAGYIGGMLVERFAQRDDVEEVICLDKNPITQELKSFPKVLYLRANTADDTWQNIVADRKPDVVIHCAWQIRELYGRPALQHRWNIFGSKNIISFVQSVDSIKKFIFFSTVAVYGAYPENTLQNRFTEESPLREEEYRYGREKREVEEWMARILKDGIKGRNIQTIIVRPASVVGPQYLKRKRGINLQSWLRSSFPFFPIGSLQWCRQFVHEDDLCRNISVLLKSDNGSSYAVYNISSQDYIDAFGMAAILKKRAFVISPRAICLLFFILRHISLASIPTSPGGWKFYTYPIVVDGQKLERDFNYKYTFTSSETFGLV